MFVCLFVLGVFSQQQLVGLSHGAPVANSSSGGEASLESSTSSLPAVLSPSSSPESSKKQRTGEGERPFQRTNSFARVSLSTTGADSATPRSLLGQSARPPPMLRFAQKQSVSKTAQNLGSDPLSFPRAFKGLQATLSAEKGLACTPPSTSNSALRTALTSLRTPWSVRNNPREAPKESEEEKAPLLGGLARLFREAQKSSPTPSEGSGVVGDLASLDFLSRAEQQPSEKPRASRVWQSRSGFSERRRCLSVFCIMWVWVA